MTNRALLLRESVAIGSAELGAQVLEGKHKMLQEEFIRLRPPEVQAALDRCLHSSAFDGSALRRCNGSSGEIPCASKCSVEASTLVPVTSMVRHNPD